MKEHNVRCSTTSIVLVEQLSNNHLCMSPVRKRLHAQTRYHKAIKYEYLLARKEVMGDLLLNSKVTLETALCCVHIANISTYHDHNPTKIDTVLKRMHVVQFCGFSVVLPRTKNITVSTLRYYC